MDTNRRTQIADAIVKEVKLIGICFLIAIPLFLISVFVDFDGFAVLFGIALWIYVLVKLYSLVRKAIHWVDTNRTKEQS